MISGNDVLREPLIWPWDGDAEVVAGALGEAANLINKVLHSTETNVDGHRDVYVRQRGVMIGAIDREWLPNIYTIAETLQGKIGLRFEPSKSSVRHQKPVADWPKLRWHQDGAGMELTEEQDSVVVWCPLQDIDGTRPSLAIANIDARPKEHLREVGCEFLAALGVPEDTPYTILNGLSAGTAVLMSPYTVHRTYYDAKMTNPRVSMDLRFYQ